MSRISSLCSFRSGLFSTKDSCLQTVAFLAPRELLHLSYTKKKGHSRHMREQDIYSHRMSSNEKGEQKAVGS